LRRHLAGNEVTGIGTKRSLKNTWGDGLFGASPRPLGTLTVVLSMAMAGRRKEVRVCSLDRHSPFATSGLKVLLSDAQMLAGVCMSCRLLDGSWPYVGLVAEAAFCVFAVSHASVLVARLEGYSQTVTRWIAETWASQLESNACTPWSERFVESPCLWQMTSAPGNA
jgi:hypothetical protein